MPHPIISGTSRRFCPADVDVVILNYRVGLLAAAAAQSAHENGAVSILVVDNHSPDDSLTTLKQEVSATTMILPLAANIGFSAGNNQGAALGRNPFLLFMNPDVVLHPQALQLMLDVFNVNPGVGIVGPALVGITGEPQPSAYFFIKPLRICNSLFGFDKVAGKFNLPFLSGNADLKRNGSYSGIVESLYGACFLVRRDAFLSVNGFDEDFFLYCEETDLFFRLSKAGWKAYRCAEAQATHHHGQSAQQVSRLSLLLMNESHRLYARKHFSFFGRILTAIAFIFGLCLRIVFSRTTQARANYFSALGIWLGWTPSVDPRKRRRPDIV